MGVWSNVYLYQEAKPPSFAAKILSKPIAQSSLDHLESIAASLGTQFFRSADIGNRFYDGFCEDTVLAEVEDVSFPDLINETKRYPRAGWVSVTFEGSDFKWTDQINAAMDEYPAVTGDYHVYGVSLVVGQIRIEDEEGDCLFHSNLMLYFYGDSSPNDCKTYADHLLQCDPVQAFLGSIASAAPPSDWKSALIVS
jgi:hypothetical protein